MAILFVKVLKPKVTVSFCMELSSSESKGNENSDDLLSVFNANLQVIKNCSRSIPDLSMRHHGCVGASAKKFTKMLDGVPMLVNSISKKINLQLIVVYKYLRHDGIQHFWHQY